MTVVVVAGPVIVKDDADTLVTPSKALAAVAPGAETVQT